MKLREMMRLSSDNNVWVKKFEYLIFGLFAVLFVFGIGYVLFGCFGRGICVDIPLIGF